jgi:hypothetical protein
MSLRYCLPYGPMDWKPHRSVVARARRAPGSLSRASEDTTPDAAFVRGTQGPAQGTFRDTIPLLQNRAPPYPVGWDGFRPKRASIPIESNITARIRWGTVLQ